MTITNITKTKHTTKQRNLTTSRELVLGFLHCQNNILQCRASLAVRKTIQTLHRAQRMLAQQSARLVQRRPTGDLLVQLHIVHILDGDATLLDVLVALRRELEVKQYRCRNQTERSAHRDRLTQERLQIQARLPRQCQMLAKLIAGRLQCGRLAGQNHGTLACFAQQTGRIEQVTRLPLFFGSAHVRQLVQRLQIVRVSRLDVLEHWRRRRRCLSLPWLRWQRIVLLITIPDEFRFGQITHRRRDQLDELLIPIAFGALCIRNDILNISAMSSQSIYRICASSAHELPSK